MGKRDRLTPPSRLLFVGRGDFRKTGEDLLRHFIDLAQLRPTDRVLDVGCGVGRMALPLARYLGPKGSYEGFDVVDAGIDWCRKQITARYPRFRFQAADLHHDLYNPSGRFRASEYRFPYDDRSFDFVFATSVATHLLAPDLENYLREISRVSRPGGRSLVTFFLLSDESRELLRAGRSDIPFLCERGPCLIASEEEPGRAVAYDEAFIKSLYERCLLRIDAPVHFGSWPGRSEFLSYQDLVVATKL